MDFYHVNLVLSILLLTSVSLQRHYCPCLLQLTSRFSQNYLCPRCTYTPRVVPRLQLPLRLYRKDRTRLFRRQEVSLSLSLLLSSSVFAIPAQTSRRRLPWRGRLCSSSPLSPQSSALLRFLSEAVGTYTTHRTERKTDRRAYADTDGDDDTCTAGTGKTDRKRNKEARIDKKETVYDHSRSQHTTRGFRPRRRASFRSSLSFLSSPAKQTPLTSTYPSIRTHTNTQSQQYTFSFTCVETDIFCLSIYLCISICLSIPIYLRLSICFTLSIYLGLAACLSRSLIGLPTMGRRMTPMKLSGSP